MNWFAQRFELSRGGSQDNIRPMEGLRGFAVFLVFLVHYVSLVEPWVAKESITWIISHAMHTIGNSGVDLFFVLSGYLIYGSLMDRQQPFLRFMSRRIERIYPAFLVVLLLYLMLSFAFPSESKLPSTFAAGSVYLIQNVLLLPGIFPIEPIITVAWSLSYEMLYYLAIPGVIMLLNLHHRSAVWRTTFFLVVTLATTIYCALNGGHMRLVMFIAGILLFESTRATALSTPSSPLALLLLVAGLLALLLPLGGSVGNAFKVLVLFFAFFTTCLTCFKNPSGGLAQAFTWTPLRWLGNISYSYYLIHGLALKSAFLILASVFPSAVLGPWFFWLLLPIAFLMTLPPSAALYLLVERPLSIKPPNPSLIVSHHSADDPSPIVRGHET
ncbi:acyltransferase [Acidovorax sp. SRB_14]|uniref:acyltransferase family protein n=1 Tax=Acidovorax sp. SRB_14 TaxID=1962699 RepID=UPI0015630DF9|nr:acyltransferase [Acidovorax sp. SRB_14]NMM81194.1 acyltransferase [Acidovorax sp. SRB_14]